MSDHSEEHNTFNEEARRETNMLVAISRAIEASPVKHQGTREEAVRAIKAKLEASHTLRVGDRGWVAAFTRDGNPADFAKLVTDTMLLDKSIGDSASIAAAVKAGTIELGSPLFSSVSFLRRMVLASAASLPTDRRLRLPLSCHSM